jgi:hypothetical protein
MAKKKTRTQRPKTLREWEPFIMQVTPLLVQTFGSHLSEVRRIEEKKLDLQMKLHEALLKSVESLHAVVEDIRWRSLRDEANREANKK